MKLKQLKIEILNNEVLLNKPRTIKEVSEVIFLKHEVYYLTEKHQFYEKRYKIINVYITTISIQDDPRVYEIVISKKFIPDNPIILDDLNKIVINIDLSQMRSFDNYRFEDEEYLLLFVDKSDIEEF